MLVLTTTGFFGNRFLRLKHKSLGLVLVYVTKCVLFIMFVFYKNLLRQSRFTISLQINSGH
jgi:hypothetical protein